MPRNSYPAAAIVRLDCTCRVVPTRPTTTTSRRVEQPPLSFFRALFSRFFSSIQYYSTIKRHIKQKKRETHRDTTLRAGHLLRAGHTVYPYIDWDTLLERDAFFLPKQHSRWRRRRDIIIIHRTRRATHDDAPPPSRVGYERTDAFDCLIV
jgi:hypothetical protein